MRAFITLTLTLLASTGAIAQQTPADTAAPPKLPLWEAGFFGVAGHQQAYPGSKQHVNSGIVLPFLIYRGDWLRSEEGSVGVRALRSASTEIDVGLAGSFGSAPRDNDARRGMPRIGTLAELGPRVKWDLGPGFGGGRWRAALPLRAVLDVDHGFDYRGVAFEPDIGWGRRSASGWGYGVNLGLMVGSRRLAETFYEVAPQFVTPTRPAYEAKAGLISTRLGINAFKPLSADWRFFVFARIDTVKGAANRDSPLVDKPTGASVGFGLAWTGWRSEQFGTP